MEEGRVPALTTGIMMQQHSGRQPTNGADKPKVLEAIGVLIPTEKVGNVIGKAGAGLRSIREGAGKCRFECQSEILSGGVRRCNIGGNADQISKGFALLIQKAYQNDAEPHQVSVLVPEDWAGLVAGKGGENLRNMRQNLKVKVTLERENYGGERLALMEGGVHNLGNAIRIVVQGGNRVPQSSAFAIAASGAVEGGFNGVRPVNADPEVLQVHMAVNSKACGGIMGKGGDQLKQFEKTTGAKISVSQHSGTADRRVVIIGSYMQCAAAQKAVYTQLCEMAPTLGIAVEEVTTHVLIRTDACGAVVGKSGENLKRIRESAGVKLDMGKAQTESKGQRPCTLKGSLGDVLKAQQMIFDIVKECPMNVSYSDGPNAPQKRPAPGDGLSMPMPFMAYQAPVQNAMPKRARTDQSADASDTIKMLIPAQTAGVVIGKQGAGLKQIRENTGVNINVVPQDQAPYYQHERIVVLAGPLQAKHTAIDMILKATTSQDQYEGITMKLLVRSQSAGKLIGKQAQTIKAIRESCGIQLQVEREEVLGDRLVSVQGTLLAVSAATSRILSHLE